MKCIAIGTLQLAAGASALACPQCVSLVDARIHGDAFWGYLLLMAVPVLVITAIGVAVHHADRLPWRRPRK
ncbi:MAG: hypothetical protein ACJ8G7_08720 [Rhizobacter sp.]